MRKAWFTSLQLLVLIFLFLFFPSFRSPAAEAGETAAAALQFSLTLAPAEAVVPGDRITRQILLENLTDRKLKYSVEGIRCTGTAELLPYFTLQLAAGEEVILSGRADQLGTMASFPISIPAARESGTAGGAVRAEAAGEAGAAESRASKEKEEATALRLTLDFSPAAKASLMGSEAEIQLLLSAEEVTAVGESETPVSAETEAAKTETLPSEPTDADTDIDTAGKNQPETAAAEERKESAETNGGAGNVSGRSSRGVLFGGAISFLSGPGTERILEAVEDPPMQTDEQEDRDQEAADDTRKTDTETNTAGLDTRLQELLERLRQRQKKQDTATAGKTGAVAAEEITAGAADRRLTVSVAELGGQGLSVRKTQSYYGGEAVTVYLGEANMKRSIKQIIGTLGNLLLWILIFCALYFALSSYQERRTGKPFFFMGYKPVLILSESMEPTYPKGAIVLVRKQRDSAEPGDVVMFSPEEGSGSYVIHRIVGESEAGFITRGDHNNTEDRGAIAPEQILGTVKGLIWC